VLDEDRLKRVKMYHSSDSVLQEVASKVITVCLKKWEKQYQMWQITTKMSTVKLKHMFGHFLRHYWH
jgi:hypothetical protein